MSQVDAADQWIVDIQLTLGGVHNNNVKTGSICRVPEKILEDEAKGRVKGFSYWPKCVAMGPIHRGTRSDLKIMEETKWRSMHSLLCRPTQGNFELDPVKTFIEPIKPVEAIIRASYGEKIEMGSEEFARIMLLDTCFLLELLVRLTENNNDDDTDPHLDDKKKVLRLLTDLTLLENQIPFFLLTTLSSRLLPVQWPDADQPELATLLALSRLKQLCPEKLSRELCPQKLAKSLFKCDVDVSEGVYHFLHLIHLCSPDPCQQQDKLCKDPIQLKRCARKLQAFGITIEAPKTNNSQVAGKDEKGTIASDALKEFVDKFEFKIEFNAGQLIIPTLHIKEATEVKWRNLIAWEQLGLIGIGYKFTSYAYFFKGLVSSVHDIQLLKRNKVIIVDHKEAKDEDLVTMFQSIVSGEEQMDGRYAKDCDDLNKVKVNGVVGCCVLIFRMVWHYFRRFLEWLQSGLTSSLRSFVDIYLGTPWKFIGVVVGAALLALTITQTIYAIRAA